MIIKIGGIVTFKSAINSSISSALLPIHEAQLIWKDGFYKNQRGKKILHWVKQNTKIIIKIFYTNKN